MREFKHIPVLLNECIEGLNIKKDGIYVDGTLGGAGHSFEIATKLENTGKLIGIDRDQEAIKKAKETLKNFNNVIYVQDNHDNIKEILEKLNIAKVDGIHLDLGVWSYQIDDETRGFEVYFKVQDVDYYEMKFTDEKEEGELPEMLKDLTKEQVFFGTFLTFLIFW